MSGNVSCPMPFNILYRGGLKMWYGSKVLSCEHIPIKKAKCMMTVAAEGQFTVATLLGQHEFFSFTQVFLFTIFGMLDIQMS